MGDGGSAVAQTIANCEAEFDDFFRRSRKRMVAYAYALTSDVEFAQDVSHEAFCRAWENWDRVRTMQDPEGWTRRVLRNLVYDSWRRQSRARVHGQDGPGSASEMAEPTLDHLVLAAALRKLPRHQQEVIVLFELVGLSARQVSDELGIPIGTVKTLVRRGRIALAKDLAAASAEDSETTAVDR